MNKIQIEQLLEILGEVRTSDIERFIERKGLNLDAEEIMVLLVKLYGIIDENC